MVSSSPVPRVWIFGDYRNYFHNRVTLQLIAKGRELARMRGTEVAALVLGDRVHAYAMEYVAHGADWVLVGEDPALSHYEVEVFTEVLYHWVDAFGPEILLAGATDFGREFFPRLARRLHTGLSADCVALAVDPESGLLVQTAPAFGGGLLAEVVTPHCRPQMATVHPGIFEEAPHDPQAIGRLLYPELPPLPTPRARLVDARPVREKAEGLEEADVVVIAGRGIGSGEHYAMAQEIAQLLGAEFGVSRPLVTCGWAAEDRLIGQTGKLLRARVVVALGVSGAVQLTTGFEAAETVLAVNRDPDARIFQVADLGMEGDLKMLLPVLLAELRKRKQGDRSVS